MKRRHLRLILGLCLAAAILTVPACRRREAPRTAPPLTAEGKEKEVTPDRTGKEEPLTADEQALLDVARATLKLAVGEGKTYEPPRPAAAGLLEERGVFVTLTERGELRGCIGYVLPTRPLYLAVRDMAINAALRDPRFMPVTAAELPAIDIEISIMTPLQPVADPAEVVVGKDGLMIEAGGRSGLLLPQVAPEQGWDRQQLLDGVCRKAGLPRGAYAQPGARLYKFQAHIFGGPYAERRV